ncbi:3-deoxy-7-phosphoheptulonate synthase [Immundisolibacter sp.]|uniref:3-deoxy-7-phosphoheptulonate synthase n=1 Tax=Immundisolibacter sp. TaxID=1934948 RepID=UPI003567C44B
MILILDEQVHPGTPLFEAIMEYLSHRSGVSARVHEVKGDLQTLTEIYLIGDTATLDREEIAELAGVDRVVRVSREYRILGRHKDDFRPSGFEYNGVSFSQETFELFAGLCAVDNRDHVDRTFRALAAQGLRCARMGAYKPRTSPYAFQGHGAACLPFVFESAASHGVRVIAMEVTHEKHIQEIHDALAAAGNGTGVMLQVGTRNTQNFELLKAIGRQHEFPVLFKRGFGITLEESLNAAEYLASEGNQRVVFCLRGVKSNLGEPHRNLVDFAQVPVVRRLTRMPVCVDPSHAVGRRDLSPDGIEDIHHAAVQGVVAGANMVLVDIHPEPGKALVDGPQALTLDELPLFVEDLRIAREAYLKRRAAHERARSPAELPKPADSQPA